MTTYKKKFTPEKLDKIVKVMQSVAEDMENDARDFDGKPFTGKTVAEYFGNQGAAIAAVAKAVMAISEALIADGGE